MINTKFEAYKLKRELKRSGETFKIFRYSSNEYGEPIKGSINSSRCVGKLRGLYHEQNGYIQKSTMDTTQATSKKIPMIMCLFEDADKLDLKIDDFIKIGDSDKNIDFSEYRIVGITNIQNWGIVSDISLEPIENIKDPFDKRR